MFKNFLSFKNPKTILFGLAGIATLYFLLSGNKSTNNSMTQNSVNNAVPNNSTNNTQLGDLII